MLRSIRMTLSKVAVLALVVVSSGCSDESGEAVSARQLAAEIAADGEVQLELPAGLDAPEAVLVAGNSLVLADRATVRSSSGALSRIDNLGTGLFELGADAQTGDAIVGGAAVLRNRALISGSLTYGTTFEHQQDATVTGSATRREASPASVTVSVPRQYAADPSKPIVLAPDTERRLTPGGTALSSSTLAPFFGWVRALTPSLRFRWSRRREFSSNSLRAPFFSSQAM